jgi:hypothetical protein
MSSHVSAFASWDAEKERLVLDDQVSFHAGLRKLKPGAGERFVVRVEREEDALTEAQRRYYFAACIHPLSEYTGFSEPEMHVMVKAVCMPPGKTSIMQLSKEEMNAVISHVQQWAAEVVGLVLEDPVRHGIAAA